MGKTKVQKSVAASKSMRGYKQRDKGRFKKKIQQKKADDNKYVDKRQHKANLEKKKQMKQANKKGKQQKVAEESESEDGEDEQMKDVQVSDPEASEDDDIEKMMQEQQEIEKMNDQEFQKFGNDLDLPDDTDEEDHDEEEADTDDELADYYRELGIEDDMKREGKSQLYKTEKKQKPVSKKVLEKQEQQDKKNKVINQMIEAARTKPSHATLTRIVKVVKQVFEVGQQQEQENEDVDMEEGGKNKKKKKSKKNEKHQNKNIIRQALNSAEYLNLFKFFTSEVPQLIIQASDVGSKFFEKNRCIEIKNVYGKVSQKHSILMKTYAANFTRMLAQTLSEGGSSHEFIQQFFAGGDYIVRCCLPFSVYIKKLISAASSICMQYSQMNQTAILLAFNALRLSVIYTTKKDRTSLFEMAIKKMYNEFTKESKFGGGGLNVQDNLRICQNCFVELLNVNHIIGYQLGFQYIRQLCLHLRNIRNNLSPDTLKNIYSWQFYNCTKIWVLALCKASKSELALLIHPLVQLITGVMRLTNNVKYMPFHMKLFELLTMLNQETGQFIPCVQYLMYVFDPYNEYLNNKPKALEDKQIPPSLVSLKIAKKHVDTQPIKDRIVKETVEALTLYFASNAESLSFPELIIPTCVVLRKFKKNCNNNGYKKCISAFLDLLQRNQDFIVQQRLTLKQKSLRDPVKLYQDFSIHIGASKQQAPLIKEKTKIIQKRDEQFKLKLNAQKSASEQIDDSNKQ